MKLNRKLYSFTVKIEFDLICWNRVFHSSFDSQFASNERQSHYFGERSGKKSFTEDFAINFCMCLMIMIMNHDHDPKPNFDHIIFKLFEEKFDQNQI